MLATKTSSKLGQICTFNGTNKTSIYIRREANQHCLGSCSRRKQH